MGIFESVNAKNQAFLDRLDDFPIPPQLCDLAEDRSEKPSIWSTPIGTVFPCPDWEHPDEHENLQNQLNVARIARVSVRDARETPTCFDGTLEANEHEKKRGFRRIMRFLSPNNWGRSKTPSDKDFSNNTYSYGVVDGQNHDGISLDADFTTCITDGRHPTTKVKSNKRGDFLERMRRLRGQNNDQWRCAGGDDNSDDIVQEIVNDWSEASSSDLSRAETKPKCQSAQAALNLSMLTNGSLETSGVESRVMEPTIQILEVQKRAEVTAGNAELSQDDQCVSPVLVKFAHGSTDDDVYLAGASWKP